MASKDVLKEGTRSPQGARKHLFSRESDLPTDAGEQRSAVLRVGRQLGRLAEALPGGAPHFQAQRSLSARKLSQCPEGGALRPTSGAPPRRHGCAQPPGLRSGRVQDREGRHARCKREGRRQPLGTVEAFLGAAPGGVQSGFLLIRLDISTPTPSNPLVCGWVRLGGQGQDW